ncbi:response regulator transcription factor [Thermoactinomyces sp. CICC 10523]|uniref:response regulator transcription factor n=1 Tax=Thermoactinomyces sp. CICC 10523 TaxID=2767428 RepID=UPI0018DC66AC|nr:response regulator transcription factor [Thermoactinomyces sp. CICC 10523]MBH8599439.1 response regulator transcription factor [Thermoactinomyces sp. CICC 10523]
MKKKILIVEDEKSITRFLELELRHEGYEVKVAHDGRSALRMMKEEDWQLVILDIMLPDLSGIEICRRIRSDNQVPIIMLTAKDAVPDRVSGLDAGADDYLTKPFAIEELLARLRAIERRHSWEEEANVIGVTPITLYLDERKAEAYGKEIKLTAREFDLLSYLMQNKNHVLTREMILTKVWGYDYAGDTNVVDVYIRYLRAKLESIGLEYFIETVRGVGYVVREH